MKDFKEKARTGEVAAFQNILAKVNEKDLSKEEKQIVNEEVLT